METSMIMILGILIIMVIYCLYQLIRNQIVYKIRINWIENNDSRHEKYSYDFMFDPSKRNWYGLKFPFDKDF